jgi:hypothetical protein
MDLVASASKQADLTDTGLPGGSADTILCVDAFHFASSITARASSTWGLAMIRMTTPMRC